jgi:hypothetical protein
MSVEDAQRAIELAFDVESWGGPGCVVCGRTDLRLHREKRSRKYLCHACWTAPGHYWRNVVARRFR